MGMTIEEKFKVLTDEYAHLNGKYAMMQADYENRLKADLIDILTELKNKLIDKSWNIDMYDDDLDFECCYLSDIDKVIQQKIDKLKENMK